MFDDLLNVSPLPPGAPIPENTVSASMLKHLIKHEAGLPKDHKASIFNILNTPEVFDNLMAGTAGAALTYAISKYADISPTARTLLSLAGFGIGGIIMNTLNSRKFTDYDPHTATSTIKV